VPAAGRPSGDLHRSASTDSHKEPMLGLPAEPQRDFEEIVGEVRAEMEARQRKGIRRGETEPVLTTKAM
jgi:lysophospholipid acyltransferase